MIMSGDSKLESSKSAKKSEITKKEFKKENDF